MTVASLWSVLDEAGCGKCVGAEEMVDGNNTKERTIPWNFNEINAASTNAQNRTTLAVDLSIWICEALASTAMSEHHADPALHLVYTRTTRLLSIGIKLIAVIEGKRRVRGHGNDRDSFRKRRSGTAFWKACKSCEEMLKILGVPVVRAKAEGEALCALLNQRGIVDGVISKDGDCLLFGAKVVYTRFSIENLDKRHVVRYDASELRGLARENDDADVGAAIHGHPTNGEEEEYVDLGRGDLIAFALLTGSDLVGDGLPKVGHKKAIRFIKQCKVDYPLSKTNATIDELKSWAKAASAIEVGDSNKNQERCCSLCNHPGDKRGHEKHGCETCGTEPGEQCFASSTGDRFRKALRLKALAMIPKFDPAFVVDAYMSPNDNQVPLTLLHESARSLRMGIPRLGAMMAFPHIIKGQSLAGSKEYVRNSLARLLARTILVNNSKPLSYKERQNSRLSRERPVPVEITRKLVNSKTPCYEITWSVSATVTDDDGNEVDGYEFSTIEEQSLVEKRHPDLVEAFAAREKEEAKQGDAEENRRRSFVKELLNVGTPKEIQEPEDDAAKQRKKGRSEIIKRSRFFEERRASGPRLASFQVQGNCGAGGDDVRQLMVAIPMPKEQTEALEDSTIDGEKSFVSELANAMTPASLPRKIIIFHRCQDSVGDRNSAAQETQPHPPDGQVDCQSLTPKTRCQELPLKKCTVVPQCAEEQSGSFNGARKRQKVEDLNATNLEQPNRRRKPTTLPSVNSAEAAIIVGPWVHMAPTPDARGKLLPVLTPGVHHSMSCDMGIEIKVTPLISCKVWV